MDSAYYVTTYTTTSTNNTDLFGFFMAFLGIILVIALIMYVVYSYFLSRIFKKAGVEQWKAWVPIYSTWMMLEIGKQKGWYVLLAFIPFVGTLITTIFIIIAEFNIGRSLGKSDAFVLLAIFMPIIWIIWLAIDNSKWENKAVQAKV